ncbi:hypothetical protein CMO93_04950 [Candidatus Woesearchaeota archaeon]|nr:hypothetical protein [Candidatus Woesearchaeota archaeon]|tara:strand:+ start:1835 stop:3892 length:2058 start_codon:yes stop_codon:yes gene_type:complete
MAKIPKNYKSTADIAVDKNLVNQIIGQDQSVEIIKKAAQQRRNVLLIGEPGTGKSMLGLALAELLPKEKLADIISFPNPNDENAPLIRTLPGGQGRNLVAKARIQGMNMFKNQNIIIFILVLLAMIAPWWVRSYYKSDVMFAAFFLGGMLFLAAFTIFLNFGKRMEGKAKIPKVIVDNFKKKQAPFYDATGAHAGALLGDVLHDPFQSFFITSNLQILNGKKLEKKEIQRQIDSLMIRYSNKILKREKNNYEAIHLPKNELFVLGETNDSISPVEVLSCNRYDHTGTMIKLTTSENKELIVTPEHKIAVLKDGKIIYIEAQDIEAGHEVVSKKEDVIIDEQDIINTYSKEQQLLAKSYYQYLELKKQNPSWGYKRIATKLGVSYGRTRWWWEKNSAPAPVQTVEWLRRIGLIPLKIDNSGLPFIAKVIGATFGDGGIFENLNGIFLSSSEKEAVKEFGKDIENIFRLKKDENSRIIEGGEYGHSWCYQNTNRNIIRLFLALGAPKGNKTYLELKIPDWIKLNKEYEDEFYGSFLGGELGTPIIHKQGNKLTSLEVGITGLPHLKENRISFLKELIAYLKKNSVNTTSIYEGKSKTRDSIVFRLLIEKKMDNVILFLMNIKINYCKYKVERLYKALGKWAKLKKDKYYELIQRGYGAEYTMNLLNLTPNSLYLLLNHFGPKEEATT